MIKVLAVLRTIFLVFIAGFTIRAMPLFMDVARTFDEQYARCSGAVSLLARAAWIAIAWIALETAVGWWLATRGGKRRPGPALQEGEPPVAAPPRA
jgi:hypothetical protein